MLLPFITMYTSEINGLVFYSEFSKFSKSTPLRGMESKYIVFKSSILNFSLHKMPIQNKIGLLVQILSALTV